jgi:lipopolysaccharide export LptBFGC system permease protein LptF
MIRLLDRYILKSFFSNYLLALFVLISLYIVLDLFVNMDEFTEGQRPLTDIVSNIADYYFYNLPLYFSQLSGVIILFAACGTLARLQRKNEITACLASGTSLYRVAAPVVVAGLLVNGLLILDHEVLLPSVAPKLARHRDDVEGKRLYEVWFVRDGESRLVSALKFSPGQEKVRGLIVVERSTEAHNKGQLTGIVRADRANWNAERNGWDLAGHVTHVKVTEGQNETVKREPISFYPCTLTPEDLMLRQQGQWINFLSLRQLNRLEKRGDVSETKITQVRHGRYTLPIGNMILLLLGIPFFLNRVPEGVLTQAGKSLATCSLAFIVSFTGQQMVGSAELSSSLAALPAWLPIFLFGPLAVVLLDTVKT